MENQNRLLAMLNSVSLPPSSTSNFNSKSNSAKPEAVTGDKDKLLAPLPRSPREPSPTPPPPSLQAISLHDLFGSIGSSPLAQPQSSQHQQGSGTQNGSFVGREIVSPPPAQAAAQAQNQGQGQGQGHQAKLLGMLKGIGAPVPYSSAESSTAQPQGVAPVLSSDHLGGGRSGNGTPAPLSNAPASGVSTPSILGGHSQNLLDMFKKGGTGPLSPQPPVITHTALPLPSEPNSAPLNDPTPQQPAVPQQKAQTPTSAPTAPAAQAGQGSQNQPPSVQKSMFDFVSPFDVFEKPASPRGGQVPRQHTPTSATSQPAASPLRSASALAQGVPPSQTIAQAQSQPKVPATVQPQPQSQAQPRTATPVKEEGPATPPLTNGTTAEQTNESKGSPALSGGESAKKGNGKKGEVNLAWQVGKIANVSEGKGPQATGSNIVIDISKPNQESLVVGNVRVNPTTIMKAESTAFSPGRSVAMTSSWVAYALSRGRVRLIDSATGARLVLQLPSTTNQILDLTATSTRLAIISPDQSISIYKIPARWEKDDPECQLVCRILPEVGEGLGDEGIGGVKQVEWIKKDGVEGEWLAVGGEGGVVVLRPSAFEGEVGMREVISQNKVLKSSGTLVAFCLNHTHQAIGLLSSTSFFTLYSAANFARVWNRQLPTSVPHPPSSISFCESNILVGRGNNSTYDLIQITTDLAVLSTISFVSPPPSTRAQHYTKAIYDSVNGVLWVAAFGRGSVYGFKYALKSASPVKAPQGVVGFEKMGEYPLEPILSFVLGSPREGGEGEADLFFATPTGFSQATISSKSLVAAKSATEPAISIPAPAGPISHPTPTQKQEEIELKPSVPVPKTNKQTPTPQKKISQQSINTPKQSATSTPVIKQASRAASPALIKAEVLGGDESVVETARREENGGRTEAVKVGLSVEDLTQALQKMEESMDKRLKQSLQKEISALTIKIDLANTIEKQSRDLEMSNSMQKIISTTLSGVISAELKRTVLPSLSTVLRGEVKDSMGPVVTAAVSDALQSLPKDLERGLAPHISRTVSSLAQPVIDRALKESLQSTLLPSINESSSRIYDQLSADLKSEMLQIRKEVISEQSEVLISTKSLIHNMTTSIQDLQKQVVTLSEQVSKLSLPAPAPTLAPAPPHVQPPPPPPTQMSHPSGSQGNNINPAAMEDIFLAALAGQTTASTLGLVGEYYSASDVVLPSNGSKAPLSQAVVLTLLHRLAMALVELNPSDPMFRMAASWEHRAVNLLDPRDPGMGTYLPRVVPVIQGLLNTVLTNLNNRYGNDPSVQVHKAALGQVLEILSHKVQA